MRSINFVLRYTDDVLLLNNSRLGDFVDRIYPIDLEMKDTTDTARSASYLLDLWFLYYFCINDYDYDNGTYLWSFETHIYSVTVNQVMVVTIQILK
jgi:hypothetical protein